MQQLTILPETREAKPFLKWAGGKRQLLSTFDEMYPQILKEGDCYRYIEPFVGGGAVFFDVIQKYPIKSAYLSDANLEVIRAYKVIQSKVEILIDYLGELSEDYLSLDGEKRKDFYYDIRFKYNDSTKKNPYITSGKPETVAMMLFLNRTCFNGLFRVNKRGEFNVPYGKYSNPKKSKILDTENLRAVNRVLQKVEINVADFNESLKVIVNNSFVYFDPPYRPLTKTSNFTSYSPLPFGDSRQIELANFYRYLNNNYKAKLMLSNSDPKNVDPDDNFFDDLYHGFNIERVPARRSINGKSNGRKAINELVIRNYL
jgi:DNA adenine methylase